MGVLLLPFDSLLHVGKRCGVSCAVIKSVPFPGHSIMLRLEATGIKENFSDFPKVEQHATDVTGCPHPGVLALTVRWSLKALD